MPRRQPTVGEFPPQLISLYILSAQKEVKLPLSSKGEAVQSRQKMHTLRAAMRRESHPSLAEAEGVSISLDNLDGVWYMICRPKAKSLISALEDLDLPPAPEVKQKPPEPEFLEDDIRKYLEGE